MHISASGAGLINTDLVYSVYTSHDQLAWMPNCYFLFPSHDGPVPNPFPIDDPLFVVSQFAIRDLRGSSENAQDTDAQSPGLGAGAATPQPSESGSLASDERNYEAIYNRWSQNTYWLSLEVCSIAFVELINRVLISEPAVRSSLGFCCL